MSDHSEFEQRRPARPQLSPDIIPRPSAVIPRRSSAELWDRSLVAAPSPLHTIRMVQNPVITQAEANYASKFYEHLSGIINRFNAELDNAHEVGACLANFGPAFAFHITGLGYQNPSLIILYGQTEDGQPVELVQHVTQIGVLLTKLSRKNPDEPKKPIGFQGEILDDPQPEPAK